MADLAHKNLDLAISASSHHLPPNNTCTLGKDVLPTMQICMASIDSLLVMMVQAAHFYLSVSATHTIFWRMGVAIILPDATEDRKLNCNNTGRP